jgi:hypothetical protein
MSTCLAWIQPQTHGAILKHILNMVNSFLCSSTNYHENQLLPNDLIIVRNHRDDEEDVRDNKDVLKRPRDVTNKLEIQSNLELQNLNSNPTQSPGPLCLRINAHDAYALLFGRSTYAQKEEEI